LFLFPFQDVLATCPAVARDDNIETRLDTLTEGIDLAVENLDCRLVVILVRDGMAMVLTASPLCGVTPTRW